MRFLWAILIALLTLHTTQAQEKPPRITAANFNQLTQVAQSSVSPTLQKLLWLDKTTLVAAGSTETLFYDVETDQSHSLPIEASDIIAFSTDTTAAISMIYPDKLILWDAQRLFHTLRKTNYGKNSQLYSRAKKREGQRPSLRRFMQAKH